MQIGLSTARRAGGVPVLETAVGQAIQIDSALDLAYEQGPRAEPARART
jgi:hypothetical protein